MLAIEIRTKEIKEYVAKRQGQLKASPSTIRTEVGLLHLAMVCAVEDDLLGALPLFPHVEKSPPREGSATPQEIARAIGHLPTYLQPLVKVAYATGWRGKHLRAMAWATNVKPGPMLYLPKIDGNRKRAKDVTFDCSEVPWLAELVEQQRRHVAELTLALGRKRSPGCSRARTASRSQTTASSRRGSTTGSWGSTRPSAWRSSGTSPRRSTTTTTRLSDPS